MREQARAKDEINLVIADRTEGDRYSGRST